MLTDLKKKMRDLISRNRLSDFFVLWEENVEPEAEVTQVVITRKADFGQLRRNQMMGTVSYTNGGVNRAQIVSALLSAISELEESDLVQQNSSGANGSSGPSSGNQPASSSTSEDLQNLMQRKLATLEKARILSIDAAEQFRLDEQIRELKERLSNE